MKAICYTLEHTSSNPPNNKIYTVPKPTQQDNKMKIAVVAILTISSALASEEGHMNLRTRALQTPTYGPNNPLVPEAIVEDANTPNRAGVSCTPGVFNEDCEVRKWEKLTYPEPVPVIAQCHSACDCQTRCCSGGWPLHFITAESSAEGMAVGRGGVCVDFSSGLVTAAARPEVSLYFGCLVSLFLVHALTYCFNVYQKLIFISPAPCVIPFYVISTTTVLLWVLQHEC